jgi:iron(III) transport system substrate-binding protein
MQHQKFLGSVAVAAAVLLLGACGASPTAAGPMPADGAGQSSVKAREVYDRINGLTGDERTRTLLDLAKQEGTLSIYTSNTDLDKVIERFEQTYPIEVKVYRGNSESVLQRVLQEQQANYDGNDLAETNAGELNVMADQNMLYPYKSALRDAVRKEGQADGWTATRFNVFVVGWNTTKVKPGEEPKSFEELADPKWKGRISLEVGDVDWFAAMYTYYLDQGKTDAEVRDLFNRVVANAKIAKGHTAQGELLSAGQFAVTASSYSHTIDKAAAQGAPVSWHPASGSPVQPIVIRPNGVALMKTAPHPAAAMLFVDYELSEGQKILHESSRVGSIPTANDPLAGLRTISVPEKEMLDNPKKWDALYEEFVQSGREVK